VSIAAKWEQPEQRRPPPAGTQHDDEEVPVSFTDKVKNQVQSLTGKGKQRIGGATGDRSLQAEGDADQAKGDLKQAGEKVKDAFKR
jgi:uncharacterized protein YjbJ (UPF0337 family)